MDDDARPPRHHSLSPTTSDVMRRLLANLGLLIGGKSVSGLLGLGYLALTVRTLGVETFGVLIIIHTVVEVTQSLVKFQSWQPILRYGTAALQEGRLGDLRRLVLFSARLDIGSAAAGTVAAATAIWFIGTRLGLPADVIPAATLYTGSLLFMITSTPVGLLRLLDRFKLVVLEDNVEALIRLVGGAILFQTGGGLSDFLILWAAAAAAGALTSVGLAWREARRHGLTLFPIRPDNRPLSAGFDGIWRFVLSTNANSSLALLTNQLPTLAVGVLLGAPQAALFRIARQVAEAAAKPVKLMTAAIYPEFARFASSNDLQAMWAFLGRALRLSAVGAAFCTVLLYLAGPWILTLIGGAQMTPAFNAMLLLGGAALIGVSTFALEPALISIGRAPLALGIRLVAAVLYLPSLVLLVPLAGIEGAGVAAVIAATAIALMQAQSVLSYLRARTLPLRRHGLKRERETCL